MGKIDLTSVPVKTGSIYPAPFAEQMAGRSSLRLGQAGGLTQFGANLVILEPGARSSLRHWHAHEDEFVMVTEGELVLVQNTGEVLMQPGDCAAFPANDPDGHCFVNQTDTEARFLVVGTKANPEFATYPDDDLKVEVRDGTAAFTHHDGTPYRAPDVTP
jgi:uncharacterized cupin superfamily protein